MMVLLLCFGSKKYVIIEGYYEKEPFGEKYFVPAEVLEKSVELEQEIKNDIKIRKPIKEVKEYWKTLGPGLTTGALMMIRQVLLPIRNWEPLAVFAI